MVAGRYARQAVGVGVGGLDGLDGLINHRVDLRIILLHVLLRDLEELALGLLHQVVDVNGLVESLRLHATGEGDELSGERLLGDDVRVVLDVGRGSHTRAELGDVGWAAHLVEAAHLCQLLGNGEHIDGSLRHAQVADGGS